MKSAARRAHVARLVRDHGLRPRAAQRLAGQADLLVKRVASGEITRDQAMTIAYGQAAAAVVVPS